MTGGRKTALIRGEGRITFTSSLAAFLGFGCPERGVGFQLGLYLDSLLLGNGLLLDGHIKSFG